MQRRDPFMLPASCWHFAHPTHPSSLADPCILRDFAHPFARGPSLDQHPSKNMDAGRPPRDDRRPSGAAPGCPSNGRISIVHTRRDLSCRRVVKHKRYGSSSNFLAILKRVRLKPDSNRPPPPATTALEGRDPSKPVAMRPAFTRMVTKPASHVPQDIPSYIYCSHSIVDHQPPPFQNARGSNNEMISGGSLLTAPSASTACYNNPQQDGSGCNRHLTPGWQLQPGRLDLQQSVASSISESEDEEEEDHCSFKDDMNAFIDNFPLF